MILYANIKLAAAVEIHKSINKGLIESIQLEKRNRQHGKSFNLYGKEDSGAQFFSPSHILKAREYQVAKEAIEAQKKQQYQQKKVD